MKPHREYAERADNLLSEGKWFASMAFTLFAIYLVLLERRRS